MDTFVFCTDQFSIPFLSILCSNVRLAARSYHIVSISPLAASSHSANSKSVAAAARLDIPVENAI